MNSDRLRRQLSVDEGRKPRIYTDTMGKITGGVGRNLTDKPFSEDEIDLMLTNDINDSVQDARSLVPGFDHIGDVRQEVLTNMSFNMGYNKLVQFKKFLAAVNGSEWEDAANEMLNSRWAQQVGARATRLSNAMRTGAF